MTFDECPEDPVEMTSLVGKYRCPSCGCTVLAQMPHPPHQQGCWLKLDKPVEEPQMDQPNLF